MIAQIRNQSSLLRSQPDCCCSFWAPRIVVSRTGWTTAGEPHSNRRSALDGLPMQIGDWTGEEVSLDEAMVRGTDTDAHLSRRYVRRGGSESISLYIACGVHVSRLMAHRPEICYRRAGWTLVDCRSSGIAHGRRDRSCPATSCGSPGTGRSPEG